jgi:DNA-binding transcriptional MerR regulator
MGQGRGAALHLPPTAAFEDAMTEGLHKIGDVAEKLGTTIRAIRYYEEEGLLKPVRTPGGTRLYSARHLDRLRAILALAKNGYPLEAIRALAELRTRCATGDETRRAVVTRLEELLDEIEQRMHDLRSLSVELRAARNVVQQCAGCHRTPSTQGCPQCPVLDRLPYVEMLNLIWDQESGAATREA